MKNTKKIISLVLAICMLASLAISASAANTVDASGGTGTSSVTLSSTADGSIGGDPAATKMSVTVPTVLPIAVGTDGTVSHRQNRCTSKYRSGRPKTASAFPAVPSVIPSAPQCTAIVSGRWFHMIIPYTAGSRITADERRIFALFCLIIAAVSFQIRKPEHRFLQHRGIDLIENEFSLPGITNQVGFF